MQDLAIAMTNSLSRNGNGGMLAPLGFIDGAVNAPGMFFNTQVNMGLHRAALNDMRIVMDGQSVAQFQPTFVNIQAPDLQVQGVSVLTENSPITVDDITANSVKIVGDADNTLDVDRAGTGEAGFLLRNNEGGVKLKADGGDFSLQQTDAAGAVQDTWITADQNGAVSLRFNNADKLATTNTGVNVTGNVVLSGGISGGTTINVSGSISGAAISGTTGTFTGAISGASLSVNANTEPLIQAERPNASPARMQVRNSEGGVTLRTDAGGFQLYQIGAGGGVEDIWIDGDANGSVGLRFNSSQKLATTNTGVSITGTMTSSGDAIADGLNINNAIAALQALQNSNVGTNPGSITIPYSASNAIVIQWGVSTAGNSLFNFNPPYTQVYAAVASGQSLSTPAVVTTLTNTQIAVGGNAGDDRYWIAIGRRAI